MLNAADIIVPVDFSPGSLNAMRAAMHIAEPDGDLTLLHVIDEHFISDAVAAGLGSRDEIQAKMRERAEADFTTAIGEIQIEGVEVEKMIVVGVPFIEILKIARDLDLSMIVMGMRGRSVPAEERLFGSTAEKVLRGAQIPVLCIPF